MRIRLWLAALAALYGAASITAQTTPSPETALQLLESGNWRFASDETLPPALGEGVRRTLSSGQNPTAIIVTCADSRVPPEHIFNVGLGDLFVIRVAGNVCDPESLASIEYAAAHLGTPLCVVMAHRSCGAIAASADGHAESPAFEKLFSRMEPAISRARRDGLHGADLFDKAEVENAYETVAEAQRRSPVLRELVRLKRLKFAAARYDLESGRVEWLPERTVSVASDHTKEPALASVPGMPPHVALTMLQSGHRRFLSGASPTADLSAKRRGQLLESQRPFAVVLTCADSRVAPEHIFDVGLGELFVIRVAGNALSDEALASIEYAIHHLGTSLVVGMGHESCGAITAACGDLGDPSLSASMRELFARLEPAVSHARGEGLAGPPLIERAIELNTTRVLSEIRSRSKLARQLEMDGRLGMVGVSYQLATGDLKWLREETPQDLHTAAVTPSHGATHHAPADGTNTHGDAAHHDPHHAPAHNTASTHAPAHGAEAHGTNTDGEAAHHAPQHAPAHNTASTHAPAHDTGTHRETTHHDPHYVDLDDVVMASHEALPGPPGGAPVTHEEGEKKPSKGRADSSAMLMIASSVAFVGVALLMVVKKRFFEA